MIAVSPGVREWILALADDKHLMGQQHAEWIGVTPFLEEDLAFCSIGQDELGHAALLYELLVGDDDMAIDELAFGRSADEYRSCHLAELASTEWSVAFARHWLFDLADQLRWQLVADSAPQELRDIAARVEREEVFHRMHADSILDVLLTDPAAQERLLLAVERLAPLVQGLFEPVSGEADAIAEGVVSGPFADQWPTFVQLVNERGQTLSLTKRDEWGQTPSLAGQDARRSRSDDWQPLMTRMREVIDLDHNAIW